MPNNGNFRVFSLSRYFGRGRPLWINFEIQKIWARSRCWMGMRMVEGIYTRKYCPLITNQNRSKTNAPCTAFQLIHSHTVDCCDSPCVCVCSPFVCVCVCARALVLQVKQASFLVCSAKQKCTIYAGMNTPRTSHKINLTVVWVGKQESEHGRIRISLPPAVYASI